MLPPTNRYKRHRFPAEIINHCVWLYFCFCLSYRHVEELMAERGVILTYEAVRYWCRKFRQPNWIFRSYRLCLTLHPRKPLNTA
jgi:putative transposase